jgi:hypothetical protein
MFVVIAFFICATLKYLFPITHPFSASQTGTSLATTFPVIPPYRQTGNPGTNTVRAGAVRVFSVGPTELASTSGQF